MLDGGGGAKCPRNFTPPLIRLGPIGIYLIEGVCMSQTCVEHVLNRIMVFIEIHTFYNDFFYQPKFSQKHQNYKLLPDYNMC